MRAFVVGALGLTIVAIGCGSGSGNGAGSPGPTSDDGGSDGTSSGGPDASGDDGSAGGTDGGGHDGGHDGSSPTDSGGQDAQDASMHPDGSSDGGPGPGDAAPDAPAWTGYGVVATGLEATSFGMIGSTIYFGGTDAAHGNELWTTDITPAGTKLVFDACPGSCNGYQGELLQVNGHTLFGAATSSAAGAGALVFQLPPTGTPTPLYQTSGIGGAYQHAGLAGATLVYGNQFGLWDTDGTTAGTSQITGLGSDYPEQILGIGSHVLFTAGQAGTSPVEMDLWGTDGTSAGTVKLETGNANNRVLECASNGKGYVATDNILLTITDGTAAGTQTGVGGSFSQLAGFGVLASGTVVFQGYTGNPATSGLYASDGSTITLIGPEGPVVPPVNLGSSAIFAYTGDVWVTDGTAAGTSMLMSFSPKYVTTLGAAGSYVYFIAFTLTAQAGVLPQLWKTDGTTAGTTYVQDMPFCSGSSGCSDTDYYVNSGIASGSTLVFSVEEGTGPYTFHLWSTGGTTATTHVISDALSGSPFLPVGSGVLFSTTADDLRYEPL